MPVAVARPGGEAIWYVLPVLWTTPYFLLRALYDGMSIPWKRRHCSVVRRLTPLLLGAGCVLSWRARGAGEEFAIRHCHVVIYCVKTALIAKPVGSSSFLCSQTVIVVSLWWLEKIAS